MENSEKNGANFEQFACHKNLANIRVRQRVNRLKAAGFTRLVVMKSGCFDPGFDTLDGEQASLTNWSTINYIRTNHENS